MLTVAQWRTAMQRQNGVASDLFKEDWEKLQLHFGVGMSPQCPLSGSGVCCYEASPTASLTFCSSSCRIFSVGNLWHFSVCILSSGLWRIGMKYSHKSFLLWKNCVFQSLLGKTFQNALSPSTLCSGTNSTHVLEPGPRSPCPRHCTSKEWEVISIFSVTVEVPENAFKLAMAFCWIKRIWAKHLPFI